MNKPITIPSAGEAVLPASVVTDRELEKIIGGLMIPNQGFSKAMAKCLRDARAEIARLKAPVSDEEWKYYYANSVGVREVGLTRTQINHLIAARSNPPAQKEQPRGYTRASDEGGFAERPYPPAQKENE